LVLAVAGDAPQVIGGTTGRKLAETLLAPLALAPGLTDPNLDLLRDRLAATELPPGPVLLVTTRPESFAQPLAAWLNRPVTVVDLSSEVDYGFFEKAEDHDG
jgi:hypothetical protein